MTAKVVTVFNQKGGCGKTMVSMQLAASFALRGLRALLVDMDKQGTSTIWAGQGGAEKPFPATVISLAPLREKLIGEIASLGIHGVNKSEVACTILRMWIWENQSKLRENGIEIRRPPHHS